MNNTIMLRLNRDFKRLYYKGQSQVDPLIVLYSKRNNLKINRVGITASKKIGNAVKRNRARRIVKQAYRQLEIDIPVGWDFVFVARVKTTLSNSNQIYSVIKRQIETLTKQK